MATVDRKPKVTLSTGFVAQTTVFARHFRLRRRRLFCSPVVPSTFTLNPGMISSSIGSGIGAMSLAGCLFLPLPSGFCVSPAMKEAKRTPCNPCNPDGGDGNWTATEQPDASHHASPAGDKNSQLLSCGHLPPAPKTSGAASSRPLMGASTLPDTPL